MRSGWLGLVLYEQWKLNDGPQVVVAVDTGFVELTVEVVFQSADDNVGIHGKDRDKRGIGIRAAAAAEQYMNLR